MSVKTSVFASKRFDTDRLRDDISRNKRNEALRFLPKGVTEEVCIIGKELPQGQQQPGPSVPAANVLTESVLRSQGTPDAMLMASKRDSHRVSECRNEKFLRPKSSIETLDYYGSRKTVFNTLYRHNKRTDKYDDYAEVKHLQERNNNPIDTSRIWLENSRDTVQQLNWDTTKKPIGPQGTLTRLPVNAVSVAQPLYDPTPLPVPFQPTPVPGRPEPKSVKRFSQIRN